MSTANPIALWIKLVAAWGGNTVALNDPSLPFRAVSHLPLRTAYADEVGQFIAVFLASDVKAETILPQWLAMSEQDLRDRLRGALGNALPLGDTGLLTSLGVSWEEPALWLVKLQQTMGAQLKLMAYGKTELEHHARSHPAIYQEFFGSAELALNQAKQEIKDSKLEIRRLKDDLRRFENEFKTVAGIRRRLAQAQAWQELLSITQHKLSTKIGFLASVVNRHRASKNWDPDVFDKLHQAVDELQNRLAMLEGRGSPNYQPQRYHLSDIFSHLEGLESKYQIVVRKKYTPTDGQLIEIDLQSLLDCVEELIHNAKYWTNSLASPRIELILRIHQEPMVGDMLEIHCQDNGPGVEDQSKLTIFEPFISGRKEGKGLGLHMIRRFCETYRGEAYENGRFSHGANFVMRLPLMPLGASNE